MMKALVAAGLIAGVLASTTPMPSAHAVPLPKPGTAQSDTSGTVMLVRSGRGGGGGGGFAVRSGGGGFAVRSAGPRVGGFSVGGGSFNRGAIGSARAFSTTPRVYSGNRTVSRSFGGGVKHHRPHHGHKHRGSRGFVYYGVPAYYGYSNYYAGNQCAWLYRKAVRTGSRYWWNRYHDCRDDYDY